MDSMDWNGVDWIGVERTGVEWIQWTGVERIGGDGSGKDSMDGNGKDRTGREGIGREGKGFSGSSELLHHIPDPHLPQIRAGAVLPQVKNLADAVFDMNNLVFVLVPHGGIQF